MSVYTDMVALDGAVGWWHFDETSGTSAADAAGAHTGTHVNTPTVNATSLVAGHGGKAVTYAGASSQRTTVTDAADLKHSSSLTLECWVKFTSLPTSGNLVGLMAKVGSYFLVLYNNSGTMKLYGSGNYTDTGIQVNWTPTTGVTYHVVMTWQPVASSTIFYVDGVTIGNGSQTSAAPTGTSDVLEIGSFNTGSYVSATIDEPAVYNTVLTPTQIGGHRLAGVQTLGDVHTTLTRMLKGETSQGTVRIYGLTTSNAWRIIKPDGTADASATVDADGLATITPSASSVTGWLQGYTDNTYATKLPTARYPNGSAGYSWTKGQVFDRNPSRLGAAGVKVIDDAAANYYSTSQYGSSEQICTTASYIFMAMREGAHDGGTVVVKRYNRSTGAVDQSFTLRTVPYDGHEFYSLQRAPNGKLRAIYGGYGTSLFIRESSSADDVSAWGSETAIQTVDFEDVFECHYKIGSDGTNYVAYSNINLTSGHGVGLAFGSSTNAAIGTFTWHTLSDDTTWRPLIADMFVDESTSPETVGVAWSNYKVTSPAGDFTDYRKVYLAVSQDRFATAQKENGSSITLPLTMDASGYCGADLVADGYHYGYYCKAVRLSGATIVLVDGALLTANDPFRIYRWNGSAWAGTATPDLISAGAADGLYNTYGNTMFAFNGAIVIYAALFALSGSPSFFTPSTNSMLRRYISSDYFASNTTQTLFDDSYPLFAKSELDGGFQHGGFAYPKGPSESPRTVMWSVVDHDQSTILLSEPPVTWPVVASASATGTPASTRITQYGRAFTAAASGVIATVKTALLPRAASATGIATRTLTAVLPRAASAAGTPARSKSVSRSFVSASTGTPAYAKTFTILRTYTAGAIGTVSAVKTTTLTFIATATNSASSALVRAYGRVFTAAGTGTGTVTKTAHRSFPASSAGTGLIAKLVSVIRRASAPGVATMSKSSTIRPRPADISLSLYEETSVDVTISDG